MAKESFTKWFVSGAVTLPKLIVVLIAFGTAATVPFNYLQAIDKDLLPIYLAAFQALVCLLLLGLVPRPVPPEHVLLLDSKDVIAPHNLIRKLKSSEAPYKLILTQLKHTRRQVEKHVDRVDRSFLDALVGDLNSVIAGEGRIYDRELFSDIKLSKETLSSQNEEKHNIRANRMVLEDLFPEELEQYPRNEETVNRACRNIRLWIQLMFLCWAIYYGVTAISAYNKKPVPANSQIDSGNSVQPSTASTALQPQPNVMNKSDQRVSGFILNTLSTLTAVFVFFLYIEMSELTLDDNSTRSRPLQAKTNSKQQVRDAFNQKVMFACAAIVVICLDVFALQQNRVPIGKAVNIIISCGSGIVMALVIGRLGSKFLDPGTWVIAILYLYAVIQPLAIYFDDDNARFYATTLALFLKAFLWLVFYWAFTDGRLWSYVVAVRKLLLGETRTSPELLGA